MADTSPKTLPHLGVGGLFPRQSKAMCLLTSNKVAVEEEEDGDDAEENILKSVFSGGGTNRCPDSLIDNILVVEAVTHQHVFKCGRRWWRPFQTSRQRCRQVESVMLPLLGAIHLLRSHRGPVASFANEKIDRLRETANKGRGSPKSQKFCERNKWMPPWTLL